MFNSPKLPLSGIKIVEFAGLGPAPFCGMLLADMGAQIITITPPSERTKNGRMPYQNEPYWRGRTWLPIDLKQENAAIHMIELIKGADALFEGFRPGVMERLGLSPEICLKANPKLVYGRMTGWGQNGPLAQAPGHDPNYLAITGTLGTIGYSDRAPVFPLNLVGDFGGGGTYLAIGLLAGILHAKNTGEGQIIDAAMVDGVSSLMTYTFSQFSRGKWNEGRQSNMVDGGTPYATTYETKDGQYIVIAATEPQFYAILLEVLELDFETIPDRYNKSNYDQLKKIFAQKFLSKTRDEWINHPKSLSASISPILSLQEALDHPHNKEREVFKDWNGQKIPVPAPRFSKTKTNFAPMNFELMQTLCEWEIDGASKEWLIKKVV